jgi:hypothetical protein
MGGLNAVYFLPLLLTKRNRNNLEVVASGRLYPNFKEFVFMGSTFFLTTLAWVFFRSESVGSAFIFIYNMLQGFFVKEGYVQTLNLIYWQIGYALPVILTFFFIFEWIGRESKFGIQQLGKGWHPLLRQGLYVLMVLSIVFFANDNTQKFIYFNF